MAEGHRSHTHSHKPYAQVGAYANISLLLYLFTYLFINLFIYLPIWLFNDERLGVNAMKSGDVGRCVIVLISDGRANVPLAVSIGEEPEVAELPPGTEKLKLTDAEKKEQRAALKDEVSVCVCGVCVCSYV